MPPLSLVIFDRDGVLIDPITTRLMLALARDLGLTFSMADAVRTFTGSSLAACVADIEGRLGRSVPSSSRPCVSCRRCSRGHRHGRP